MEKDIKIAMETLKQIIDLVIVPNIDQHPEMAFNQMKILQLLTDLKSDSNSAPFSAMDLIESKLNKGIAKRRALKDIVIRQADLVDMLEEYHQLKNNQ